VGPLQIDMPHAAFNIELLLASQKIVESAVSFTYSKMNVVCICCLTSHQRFLQLFVSTSI